MEEKRTIKDIWKENKKMLVKVGVITATGVAMAAAALYIDRQEPTLVYDSEEDKWYVRGDQEDIFAEDDTVDYSKDEEA